MDSGMSAAPRREAPSEPDALQQLLEREIAQWDEPDLIVADKPCMTPHEQRGLAAWLRAALAGAAPAPAGRAEALREAAGRVLRAWAGASPMGMTAAIDALDAALRGGLPPTGEPE